MKIPVTLSLVGGQEEMKVKKELFGTYPDPDSPSIHHYNQQVELENGVIIHLTRGYIRDTVGALQDLNIIIEFTEKTDLEIVAVVLYHLLKNSLDSKLKIGKKHVDIDKDTIFQTLLKISLES